MTAESLTHKKGEYVVYKKHGIYLIDDVRKDKICGILKYYYVLKSVYDGNATVYVPADCEALVSQMERVLTTEEIELIIESSKSVEIEWTSDSTVRQELFEQILHGGDLSRVVALMKLLMNRKAEALAAKSKVPALDERTLNASQKILEEAFAFALGIEKKDVITYLSERSY